MHIVDLNCVLLETSRHEKVISDTKDNKDEYDNNEILKNPFQSLLQHLRSPETNDLIGNGLRFDKSSLIKDEIVGLNNGRGNTNIRLRCILIS